MPAKRSFPRLCRAGLVCASLYWHGLPATAQQIPENQLGALTTLATSSGYQYTRLEILAARGAQATFNQLQGVCSPDQTAVDPVNFPDCTQAVLSVFNNVRELVHSANEILANQGPTRFSLGLDQEGIGFALRWVAAEELLAPGSISTQFAQSQAASLVNRIAALRFGAAGFSIAGMPVAPGGATVAARERPLGGGAGADDIGIASRWGGFLNGSFNWGDRGPSDQEDAFAYDGDDFSLGVDYRFNARLVLGAMLGRTTQRLDFDSTRSVVSGGIRSKGWGLTLYGLQEWDGPYLSASLGYQQIRLRTRRDINYPSFNPDVESTYATATGRTDSGSLTATLDFGWPFSKGGLGAELYGRTRFDQMKIDAFSEASFHNSGSLAGQPAGFDFSVGAQNTSSLTLAVGTRLQKVFTPSFGVLVPYLRGEYHHLVSSRENQVNTVYNAISDTGIGVPLPGDRRDEGYFTVALGTSAVLPHGWQLFGQVQKVMGLEHVSSYTLAGGIRGEF